tara:strand:+ start:176 stop:502 length:327 start_codon:yes stop_codon:yes gene_type:complete
LEGCEHRTEVTPKQDLVSAPPNACTAACTGTWVQAHSDHFNEQQQVPEELEPDADDASPSPDADLRQLIEAWPDLPDADRPAVVAHLAALVRMSPAKRQAILTLTRGD